MTSLRRAFLVLALASMAGYGCGDVTNPNNGADGGNNGNGDGGGGGGDANGGPDAFNDPCAADSIAYEDFWDCAMSVACEVFTGCLGAGLAYDECLTLEHDLQLFDNYPVAVTEQLFDEAINAGTMSYDPDAAAACLAGLRDAQCWELFDSGSPLEECGIFTGTVPNGGNCFHEEECGGNAPQCIQAQCGGGQDVCCVGMCQVASPVGGNCGVNNGFCEPGAYCRNGTCSAGQPGDTCSGSYECDPQYYCNPNGVCQADLPTGGVCTDDSQCSLPQLCLGNDLPNATMGNCGNSYLEGHSCDGYCVAFGTLYCDQPDPNVLGTCRATPNVGEQCVGTNGTCGYFLECDANNVCQELGALNEPCGSNNGGCQLGLYCTTEITGNPTGTCAAPGGTGAQCGWQSHCDSGLCVNEQCADYPGCFP